MVNRVGDGGCCATDPQFTQPFGTQRIDQAVWFTNQRHIDGRRVSVHRNKIVSQVGIHDCTETSVMNGFLQESLADSPNYRAE